MAPRSLSAAAALLVAGLAAPAFAEPAGSDPAPPEVAVSDRAEHRLGAGVSTGITHLGGSTGRSLELAVEVAIGPAASLRLEAGELRFDDFGRRDRRASAGLVLDLTTPLSIGSSGAVGLTPFVEGSVGFTGTETGIETLGDHDWRPHLQAGGGLRLALGARVALSARVAAGVQRAPEMFVILDEPATIAPPIAGRDRERYTRWQLAALVRL